MNILNKHSDYAIRALIALGRKRGERISARALAEEQAIPYQFLRRILQELIRQGLVVSKEGARGGVALEKDPGGISVADVIRIFQGPVQVSECLFRKQICSNRANCVLRHELMQVEQMVNERFAAVTVGKLIADLDAMEQRRPSGQHRAG